MNLTFIIIFSLQFNSFSFPGKIKVGITGSQNWKRHSFPWLLYTATEKKPH